MGELQRTAQAPLGLGEDDPSSIGRIDALVLRALGASGEERARLGEDLNALLLRLPSEPQREASAALLSRLLEGGALAGLGTETVPASIAATTALLNLGYPSALEVDPQHLEALRRWQHERTRVPWLTILVTLFMMLIAQIAVVTLGSPGAPPYDPDVLAGVTRPEPSWLTRYGDFVEGLSLKVLGYQFLAGAAAFLFAVVGGRVPTGRFMARRAFLLLFGLGTLVALFQLPVGLGLALATFLPAVGALISANLLKSPGKGLLAGPS